MTTLAKAPFHNQFADVVLRTSDNVNFYVYKVILSEASPFFKQMFSLPNQPLSSQPEDMHHEVVVSATGTTIPVVSVTENSATIDYLLRLCYPIADPKASAELSIVTGLLEVAVKYELEEATSLLLTQFRSFVSVDPLRIYAASCRMRLEEEAALAAQVWRVQYENLRRQSQDTTEPTSYGDGDPVDSESDDKIALVSYCDDMSTISAGCYQRLIAFTRTGCIRRFTSGPPSNELAIEECREGQVSEAVDATADVHPPRHSPHDLPSSFFERCAADIVVRSASGGEGIQAHRFVIQFTSGDTILQANHEGTKLLSSDGLPVIELEEDMGTISGLLRLCCECTLGAPRPPVEYTLSLEEAYRVWGAAKKYTTPDVVTAARRHLMQQLLKMPLKGYFVAFQHGWLPEVKEARAEVVCSMSLSDLVLAYVPEMESSPAKTLHGLYQAQHKYRQDLLVIRKSYGDDVFSVAAYMQAHLSDSPTHANTQMLSSYSSTKQTSRFRAPITQILKKKKKSTSGWISESTGTAMEAIVEQSRSLLDRLAEAREASLGVQRL
ncbi:hypothetical protein EUX98_g6097 [Antrodiella citrinella]|uniref:BTB domain-containing protein n=1 Tax=Antrodiella citrinella TaxID=2447956 RepID=A0A4S4MQ64_9APHY|nr:hypothetical protein EUX98_g6097 [Antrodiella citrinella]